MQHSRQVWIFGYGSLMWRAGFEFVERRPGFVMGYRRRFWQGSTDHRGIVGAPGRVVTLLPSPDETCWGIAYRVAVERTDDVVAQLDHREKGGYDRVITTVRDADGAFADALMYLATPDNPDYLGCAPLPEIAEQVRASVGPSGTNLEYVLNLAAALRRIGAEDQHVFRLAALVSRASR